MYAVCVKIIKLLCVCNWVLTVSNSEAVVSLEAKSVCFSWRVVIGMK